MAPTNDSQKQYVWLVRYGLTEHPLVESVGPFDSDIDPNEGITHANSIASRIAASGQAAPQKVYASPFLRTVHTAHIVASALPKGTSVCVEEGLTEWQVPSLLVEPNGKRTYPRLAAEHAVNFDTIDTSYRSLNPQVADEADNPDGAPQFEESQEKLVVRCSKTLETILQNSNEENIGIVSHAPCDIAMALALDQKTLEQAKGKWEAWPLGGLTLFSRPLGTKEWTLEFYGDPSHMPGEYKKGLKRWTLPALAD